VPTKITSHECQDTERTAQQCPLCSSSSITEVYKTEFQGRTWRLGQCESCGLHFTLPFPTAQDIISFYSGDDYHARHRLPGVSEEVFGPKYQRYLNYIRKYVTKGRSLDVGCSVGLLVKTLKDAGFEAEGLEANSESARWGSERFDISIHTGILEQSIDKLGRYDLVTLTDVLEHTLNPVQSLRMIRKIMNPGGHVLVTFPDIHAPASRYFWLLSRLFQREWLWCTCHIPKHTWEFTRETATKTFQTAGFSVVGFQRAGMPYRFSGKLAPLSWPARVFTAPVLETYFGSQMEFILRMNNG
jgi:2-polyprenyl-3-methyl-5-hydroxy-6-metoxy-1,4-benzoquinol methylase